MAQQTMIVFSSTQGVPIEQNITALLVAAPAVLAVFTAGCGGSSHSGSITGQIVEYTIPTANSGPAGLVTGPDNNIWFLESNNNTNKIAKITTNGSFKEYQLPTTTAFPESIVSAPDGNLWYVDESNDLGKVTTSGSVILYTATNAGELTVGPDHNLWVANFRPITPAVDPLVNVFSTAGALLHSYDSGTTNQLESITPGPDGNLWMDTFSGGDVIKMTTGGTPTPTTLGVDPGHTASDH